MKIPTVVCENCGSHSIRLARYKSPGERLLGFFGFQPFRCRDCRHRFTITIWPLDKIAYAKCPKCLRMELAFWSKKHYRPSGWTNFQISLGAQRYRCPACRCNFVSFRPRKRTAEPVEAEDDSPNKAEPVQAEQGTGVAAQSHQPASVAEVAHRPEDVAAAPQEETAF